MLYVIKLSLFWACFLAGASLFSLAIKSQINDLPDEVTFHQDHLLGEGMFKWVHTLPKHPWAVAAFYKKNPLLNNDPPNVDEEIKYLLELQSIGVRVTRPYRKVNVVKPLDSLEDQALLMENIKGGQSTKDLDANELRRTNINTLYGFVRQLDLVKKHDWGVLDVQFLLDKKGFPVLNDPMGICKDLSRMKDCWVGELEHAVTLLHSFILFNTKYFVKYSSYEDHRMFPLLSRLEYIMLKGLEALLKQDQMSSDDKASLGYILMELSYLNTHMMNYSENSYLNTCMMHYSENSCLKKQWFSFYARCVMRVMTYLDMRSVAMDQRSFNEVRNFLKYAPYILCVMGSEFMDQLFVCIGKALDRLLKEKHVKDHFRAQEIYYILLKKIYSKKLFPSDLLQKRIKEDWGLFLTRSRGLKYVEEKFLSYGYKSLKKKFPGSKRFKNSSIVFFCNEAWGVNLGAVFGLIQFTRLTKLDDIQDSDFLEFLNRMTRIKAIPIDMNSALQELRTKMFLWDDIDICIGDASLSLDSFITMLESVGDHA